MHRQASTEWLRRGTVLACVLMLAGCGYAKRKDVDAAMTQLRTDMTTADRAIEVFFREPVDVAVATLSSVSTAKDPDELLRQEGGRDRLLRAIESAPDLLTFRFARLRQRLAGASPTATASGAVDSWSVWPVRVCTKSVGSASNLSLQ